MEIDQALEQLDTLYAGWGIIVEDWRIVGEWALRLQGYDVEGKLDSIDTVILQDAVPWKFKEGYCVIPPKGSVGVEQYNDFMQRTGYRLDIHTAEVNFFQRAAISYKLPNKRLVCVNSISSEIETLGELIQTYIDYNETEKITEHLELLSEMMVIADKKGDKGIHKSCKNLLERFRQL